MFLINNNRESIYLIEDWKIINEIAIFIAKNKVNQIMNLRSKDSKTS